MGGNNCISHKFAKSIAILVGNLSVVDLGCGLGQYRAVMMESGVNWKGYDGAENIEI